MLFTLSFIYIFFYFSLQWFQLKHVSIECNRSVKEGTLKVITVLLTNLTSSAPCRITRALPCFFPISTVTPSHIVSAYLCPASRAECQRRQWGFWKMLAIWEAYSGSPGSSLAAWRLGGMSVLGDNVNKVRVALLGLLASKCRCSRANMHNLMSRRQFMHNLH